ncbi:hypothetical protein V1511DRAFT_499155 [Dipodascopsis uninucleata]
MTSKSEFNSQTTGLEVCKTFPGSIKDRVFLITGCSPNGLGLMTAKSIASQKPKLIIIAARSGAKLEKSKAELEKAYPGISVRILIMDLSSPTSVRKASDEVVAYPEDIDVLINNAGVMMCPKRTLSEFGVEMQLGTNHIGHFLFTNLILDKLLASAKTNGKSGMTRIINLSSSAHMSSPFRFSDYNFEKEAANSNFGFKSKDGDESEGVYDAIAAYGQSKTANILFTLYLQKHLADKGIVSYAVHPGVISTELGRYCDDQWLSKMIEKTNLKYKTQEEGVSTTLVAGLDPALCKIEGLYLSDCQFSTAAEWASNDEFANELWNISEEIVGQKFSM